MKKLMYILFLLLSAFNLAAQKNYVIDSVCVGVSRSYQIIGEKGSTYEWYVYDTLGNVVLKPTHIDFWVEKSPGDTIWSSKIKVPWNDTGEFDILTLHFSSHGCDTLEQGRVKVFPDPEADAGKDMIVCITEPVILASATASNYSSLLWTTLGDGTFDDDSKLNPVYTPGASDIIAGSAILVFNVNGLAENVTCTPVIDTLEILFGNPLIKLNQHNLLCYDDSSGSIKAIVTGGIGPFTFSWTGPGTFTANSDSIFGLAIGKYTVSVTDKLGCIVTGSVEISQPDKLIAGITEDKNVICFGESIKFNGKQTGGTLDYTQLWSGNGAAYLSDNSIVAPIFNDAPSGKYELIYTVTDKNGCFSADTLSVKVNPVYKNTIPLTVCENELPYSWRGQVLKVEGLYTDSLSTINGCDSIIYLDFKVEPSPVLVLHDQKVCEPEVVDLTDSLIFAGSSPNLKFTYWLDTLATLPLKDPEKVILSGRYFVRAENTKGCFVTKGVNAIIEKLPVLVINTPETVCDPAIVNLTDPAITAGSDKNLLLTYWLEEEMKTAIPKPEEIMVSGTYYIRAESQSGCFITKPVVVTIHIPPSAPVLAVTNPTCEVAKGTIEVTSPLGIGITYSIDGKIFQTETKFDNLAPGKYTVTAKNSDGCISSADETIGPILQVPEIPVLAVTQPDCTVPTGNIKVSSPVGAGLTYSIDGINFQTETKFENLAPGKYTISVKNSDGCIKSADETITPTANTPEKPVLAVAQPVCGVPTGTIEVTSPVGAGLTYSIDGTKFQTETKFEKLAPGKYTVTVKNSDGCINSEDETIDPALIVPEIPVLTVTQPDCNIQTGTIEVTKPIDAGLTYSIDGTIFQKETKFEKLIPGKYTVTVKNSDGCINSADETINPGLVVPEIPVLTTTQPTCDIPTGTIEVTKPIGAGFTYSIDGISFQTETKFEKLTSGDYTVTVKNSDGCINSTDETIGPELNVPDKPVLTASQPDCDIPTGTIEVTTPVGADLTYSIDGIIFQAGTKFEKLAPGDYTVTVKNSDGCISSANETIDPVIDIPEKPVLTATQPDCDISTGTIVVKSPVGAGLTYSIDGISFQADTKFEKLAPGDYTVSVKNSIGCVNSTDETIDPALLVPEIPVLATTQPDCDISTGTIEVTSPLGAGLTYSIDGTNFQTETKFEKLAPGDYTITVKNNEGCINSAKETIDPVVDTPEKPVLATTQPDCDTPTGTIEVKSPTGAGLTYSIDGTVFQTETKFEKLAPGDYTVTVKSKDGCINSVNETIDPAPLKLPVSVTIVADKVEVTEGETVTFTATPVNGGVVPAYAWVVNGKVVAGATSDVYKYAPENGDIVHVILTSDLVCTLGNPATSNEITIKVNAILPVSVTITADQINICEGGSVTFTATPDNGGTNPVYAWFVNEVEITGATSVTYTYSPQNDDVIYAVLTSSLTNVKGNPATSNEITISIRNDLPVIVTIFADKTEVCDGDAVTFTAHPFNGGTNPVYAWFVRGVEISGETSATFTYIPKNNDLVHAMLTSNLSCAFGNPAISNKEPIKVNNNATISVTIDVDKTDICEGESVTFTALPSNGGPNPLYAWFVNKVEVPGETSNTFTYVPKDQDAIYTVMTPDLMCTTDPNTFSNIKRINVAKGLPVSVSVIADKTEICEDDLVTYSATPVNGGTNPVYAWYVNGTAVSGEISAKFTFAPQKGDEVYAMLTSDVECPLDNQASSNKIVIVVNEKLPVSVSLVADNIFICDGATVIFTATPVNGGLNPAYFWYINNIPVPGANLNTYSYQPKNGDVVNVAVTSDQGCISGNPASSNKITITITGELPVSVSIDADKKLICEGDTVNYMATPVNGGVNPLYAWFVNGVEVSAATKQIFRYAPKTGDVVNAMLTSDLGCVSGNPATSNKIIVNINNKIPVSVSIAADKTEICDGEKVTFKATPTNGGTNPVYEWYVNGLKVPGETDVIFKHNPKEGDEIYVKLISGETCVINPIAVSNTIKINYISGLLVEVDITADKTLICIGETVKFTATSANGGDSPVYTWFVNGGKINGVTGDSYAYKPSDKDEIYVKLTSSEFCVIDPVALSDTITIDLTNGLTVGVSITSDKTTICDGETVTFTAAPVNGGDNPLYAWFVNGIEVKGEKGVNFMYKPKHGDKIYVKLTSSEFCVIDPVALSNTIIISVTDKLIVSVTIGPKPVLVCEGTSVTLTATPVNGGSNPVYAWFVNNVERKGENASSFTYTPKDKDKVFATLETDLICITQKTASSNVVVMAVGDIIPPEAICRNINIYLNKDGKAKLTTAQINNGSKDNCELDTLFLSRYDFGCADVGKNLVTLTAVDAIGLSDFCEATVTVLDTIKPVVICNGPFEIQLDENAQYTLTVAEVLDDASDACGIDTTYVYPHELDCDHIGLTTISLWAVGVKGDSAYCEAQVEIFGNRAPTVMDDSVSTIENIPVVIEAVLNDYDEKTSIDISTLAISIKPLHGTVSINPVNGDLTYTPNLNFSGVDVLEYRICDDGIPCEPECGKAFVFVNVKPVNDQAIAGDDYYEAGCFSVTRNVLDNDYDIDSDNLTINTNPLYPTIHGELIIDPDGTIYYFPNEGFIGIDSFEYVICDNGTPSLCDTAKVYINVDCSEEAHDPLDCELFVPEGFSPNEDGIHDFFRIMCIHNYPDAKLMIFNRNGNLLWQKEHYGNYDVWGDQYNAWWWGTSVLSQNDVGRQMINGDPRLKIGNYVYVLILGHGEVKNGTVMIQY